MTFDFSMFHSVNMPAYLPTAWPRYTQRRLSPAFAVDLMHLAGCQGHGGWPPEQNGRRLNKAVVVNMGNAMMCLLTVLVIPTYRF